MIRRCKVLVADPDRGIRTLIHRRIRALGGLAIEASTLAEALSAAANWRPDTVVMGADLDDGRAVRGAAVLQRIRDATAKAPVLCLVPQIASESVPTLLDRGADDCLVKPFDLGELTVRLHRLLRGRDVVARPALLTGTTISRLSVLTQAGCVETEDGRITLTMRELDLLATLIRADGAPVPYAGIIEAVWGKGYVGSAHMLHRTVAALRRRIEPEPAAPRLIVNVRGVGYRFGMAAAGASDPAAA